MKIGLMEQWKEVMWSGESRFTLFQIDGCIRVSLPPHHPWALLKFQSACGEPEGRENRIPTQGAPRSPTGFCSRRTRVQSPIALPPEAEHLVCSLVQSDLLRFRWNQGLIQLFILVIHLNRSH
ncbi:hypothetical protein AOLI_G00105380 [Acnodon oligacanthus]